MADGQLSHPNPGSTQHPHSLSTLKAVAVKWSILTYLQCFVRVFCASQISIGYEGVFHFHKCETKLSILLQNNNNPEPVWTCNSFLHDRFSFSFVVFRSGCSILRYSCFEDYICFYSTVPVNLDVLNNHQTNICP